METIRGNCTITKRASNRFSFYILGAHAVPKEYKGRSKEFLQWMLDLLPEMKEKQLAEFVDIFCETGVFSVEESKEFY